MAVRFARGLLKRIFSRLFLAGALAGACLAGAPPPVVTFQKHIAPILFQHCVPCHRPGESAPFSLLTYADAKKIPRRIATVTRGRTMPPWLPEAGYGEFLQERRLSDEQIQLIAKWAEAGAPEGLASDSPPLPVFTPGWQLGTPDLVLEPAKPLRVPADGPDVFWNFILSPPIRGSRYVKAIEIRPGNARGFHHANVLVDRARSVRRQEKAPGEGFAGMDLVIPSDPFDPDSHFLFWKPGHPPSVEPDGLAWPPHPRHRLCA